MPENGQHTAQEQHLSYLDSARGIAAMMVVIYHFINWKHSETQTVKIANFIFNGATAVDFFFVLSGFVLSYKYLVLRHGLDVGKFYVNRLFRLWPAFFVNLVMVVIYMAWEHRDLKPATLVDVLLCNSSNWWREAPLIRPVEYVYYIPAWTLCIELLMSMFIPFAVIIGLYNRKALWWLAAFLMLGIAPLVIGKAVFINHFVFGALAAAYFTSITGEGFVKTKIYKYRYLLLIPAYVLFSIRSIDKMFGMPPWYNKIIVNTLGFEAYDLTGVGSFMFLVMILADKNVQKVLNIGVLKFFGRISYGLYLAHWVMVMFVFNHYPTLVSYFSNEKIGFIAILFIYIAITSMLAVCLYKMIELPFIRIGKKLTGKMKPTFVIREVDSSADRQKTAGQ